MTKISSGDSSVKYQSVEKVGVDREEAVPANKKPPSALSIKVNNLINKILNFFRKNQGGVAGSAEIELDPIENTRVTELKKNNLPGSTSVSKDASITDSELEGIVSRSNSKLNSKDAFASITDSELEIIVNKAVSDVVKNLKVSPSLDFNEEIINSIKKNSNLDLSALSFGHGISMDDLDDISKNIKQAIDNRSVSTKINNFFADGKINLH